MIQRRINNPEHVYFNTSSLYFAVRTRLFQRRGPFFMRAKEKMTLNQNYHGSDGDVKTGATYRRCLARRMLHILVIGAVQILT